MGMARLKSIRKHPTEPYWLAFSVDATTLQDHYWLYDSLIEAIFHLHNKRMEILCGKARLQELYFQARKDR